MPEFVIEREMPDVGALGPAELKAAADASCRVLRKLGPDVQWVHSYVTDNKIYCVYRAANAEIIREHARLAGFPADKVTPVRVQISPMTAE